MVDALAARRRPTPGSRPRRTPTRDRSARRGARRAPAPRSRSVAWWPAASRWMPSSRAVAKLGSSGSPGEQRVVDPRARRGSGRSPPPPVEIGDPPDHRRAVREHEWLAVDGRPRPGPSAPRRRAARRSTPAPTPANGRSGCRADARRELRAVPERRMRVEREVVRERATRSPRKNASSRPRRRASTTSGSFRQKSPWWTSTICAPSSAARWKSSSELDTPHTIVVTSSAPDDLQARRRRTPATSRPRAARPRRRRSRRGRHRSSLRAVVPTRADAAAPSRYPFPARGVAQPGSALRSGRRGPQFKSGHPDRRAGEPPGSPA